MHKGNGALDAGYFAEYMVSDSFEDSVKEDHVVVADPGIIPHNGREEMKVRAVV